MGPKLALLDKLSFLHPLPKDSKRYTIKVRNLVIQYYVVPRHTSLAQSFFGKILMDAAFFEKLKKSPLALKPIILHEYRHQTGKINNLFCFIILLFAAHLLFFSVFLFLNYLSTGVQNTAPLIAEFLAWLLTAGLLSWAMEFDADLFAARTLGYKSLWRGFDFTCSFAKTHKINLIQKLISKFLHPPLSWRKAVVKKFGKLH